MLKVYICPKCGRYRFVTSQNYTCYKCNCDMALANVDYESYIGLDQEKRTELTQKYTSNLPVQ